MINPNAEERDGVEPAHQKHKVTLGSVIGGTVLVLAAIIGIVIGLEMLESFFIIMQRWGRLLIVLSIGMGVLGICHMLPFRLPSVVRLLPAAIIALITLVCVVKLFQPAPSTRRSCANNLKQLGSAMEYYRMDYDEYFPYDERGPLYSLALLYPKYIDVNLGILYCYRARSSWSKRHVGATFPEDTPFDGARWYYGYTWKCGPDPPPDFAIMADMPENHAGHGNDGYNVLCADGIVRWQKTPFCSHDPNDNIFAREPGWSADTDSWMRLE